MEARAVGYEACKLTLEAETPELVELSSSAERTLTDADNEEAKTLVAQATVPDLERCSLHSMEQSSTSAATADGESGARAPSP